MDSSNQTKCKHCGDSVEHATTVNNTPVNSDSCFGCRMRYHDAINYLNTGINAIDKAISLLEREPSDTKGIQLSDELGRALSAVDACATNVINHQYNR